MRKIYTRIALTLAAGILATSPAWAQSEAAAPRLDCTNGPLAKTYGAAPWLVFACSDGTSIVVVSTKENRAHPFFFKSYLKDGKRYVVGEGKGSTTVTAAAYRELEQLSEADITALVSTANAVPKSPAQ